MPFSNRRGALAALLLLATTVARGGPAWAVCGDHVLEPGESCDDGALIGEDGCDASCRVAGRLGLMRERYRHFIGDALEYRGGQHVVRIGTAVAALGFLETHFTALDVFDAETGAALAPVPEPFTGPIASLGARLLVTDQDSVPATIRVFDPFTGTTDATLFDPTPGDPDFAHALLGLGDAVITSDGAGRVLIFDATGPLRHTLFAPPPTDPTGFGHTLAALGPDVLIAGTDAVYRFDLGTGALLQSYADETPGVGTFGAAMVAVGGTLFVGGPGEGAVQRFDIATGTRAASMHSLFGADLAFGSRLAVVGTDLLVAATRAIDVVDAPTTGLRRRLKDPEPQADDCFGRELQTTQDGFVVASDPCHDTGDEVDTGVVYVFDPATGALLDTVRNPNRNDTDRFRATLATGSMFLARYEDIDDGRLVAYRPCIDGVLAPGEECDDGNLEDGDGCDRSCRITRCGNGTVTAGEHCDDGNARGGDGCEPDCTWGPPTCHEAKLVEARLAVRRGPGGRATIVLTGTLGLLERVPSAARADVSGAELLIADATDAALLDLSMQSVPVPPGPPGRFCGFGDGWRARGERLTYLNRSGTLPPACTSGSAAGLSRIVLHEGPGKQVTVRITARTVAPLALLAPLHAVLRLGSRENGRCWSVDFDASACRPSPSGAAVLCR